MDHTAHGKLLLPRTFLADKTKLEASLATLISRLGKFIRLDWVLCAYNKSRELVVPLLRLGMLDFQSLDVIPLSEDRCRKLNIPLGEQTFDVMAAQPSKTATRVALNIEAIIFVLDKYVHHQWKASDVHPPVGRLMLCIRELKSIQCALWEVVVLDQLLSRSCVSFPHALVTVAHEEAAVRVEEPAPEPIVHAAHEEVAVRDEALLALQADYDWADYQEQRGFIEDGTPNHVRAERSEAVYHLRFGGNGTFDNLRNKIDNGPQFAPTIKDLCRKGKPYIHLSGARVLLYPEQVDDVWAALDRKEVMSCDTIITSSKEYLLDEIMAHMPCRQRPSEKKKFRHELSICWSDVNKGAELVDPAVCNVAPEDPNNLGQSADSLNFSAGGQGRIIGQAATGEHLAGCSSDHIDAACSNQGGTLEFVIKRTFLCEAPQLLCSNSVNQSTTEATNELSMFHYSHPRGLNPRRSMASVV